MALSLWFYRLVSVGLWRDDWIGLVHARADRHCRGSRCDVLLLRELIGFSRLGRLGRLKDDVTTAIADKDRKSETAAVRRVMALYGRRPELRWALARLKEHARDVHDPGALLTLADRDLLAEIDGAARRQITTSARRVATVTALSPMALISVSSSPSRTCACCAGSPRFYGGRPGFFGIVQTGAPRSGASGRDRRRRADR